jgi:alpha-beta hydrolase superfamily lysophospholipase
MEIPVITPPLRYYFGEARIITDWVRGRFSENKLARHHPGDGRPVIVLPGLLTSDKRTKMLRRVLGKAGYATYGWGLGYNMPVTPDIFERFGAQVDLVQQREGQAVTLVGWSLGGLIARAYAAHAPENIAGVVTLGSPFSGNARSNRAWKVYEMLADHKVDSPPVPFDRSSKPPVPTAAIWSRRDGIIAVESARGEPHQHDVEVEIACGHLAMSCAPDALEAVLKLLAGGLPKR